MFERPPAFSRLGFGVAGPHGTPLVSRGATSTLIQAALAGGITVFDTGPSYGRGEAERRLGAALAGHGRSTVFISTKAGIGEDKSRDFSAASIQASLRRSLQRLRSDYVDALYLHGPAPAELTPQLLQALRDEKASGRVRHLGIAGRGSEIDAALETGLFDLLMAPVHTGLAQDDLDRLHAARKAGIGIVAIEVLSGASAGLRWPRSAADVWYSARALRQRKLAPPRQPARQALRHALTQGLADCVMISTTRAKHLQDALHTLDESQHNA